MNNNLPKTNDPIRQALIDGEINENSKITVDALGGPMSSGGFRSGYFPIRIDGIKFSVYSSVNARGGSLDDQDESIIRQVRRFLGHALELTDEGRYRYVSQSKR